MLETIAYIAGGGLIVALVICLVLLAAFAKGMGR